MPMPKIYIQQNKKKLYLPVLPAGWSDSSKQNNTSVNINALGEHTLIGKRNLREVSFSSFFPKDTKRYRAKYAPKEYKEKIEKMKRKGVVKLHLMDIYTIYATIEQFDTSEDENDPTGDMHYTLAFKEYEYISTKVKTKKKKKSTKKKRVKTSKHGRQTPTSKKASSYTVKRGDCLSAIAKKMYGDASQWKKIYNANKNKIGSNPNLIYAGTKLLIP